MFWDYTMLILIPGLLLGLWAQARVQSAYAKYSRVRTQRGLPAEEVVGQLLRQESADHVGISRTSGQLTDTLRLSDGVYGSASVAALGIAAHEAGHALQKQQGYPFLSLRSLMVPAVNIGSTLAWPIFVLGLIFSWDPLVNAGIVLFGLVVLFSLVTLPVEFDASRRAMAMLAGSGYLTQDEQKGVKAVLSAAALTYVASFVSALLQLFRLITIARRRD